MKIILVIWIDNFGIPAIGFKKDKRGARKRAYPKKKLDDVLLITSKVRNEEEEQAIRECIEKWSGKGKSIGISGLSPFLEIVIELVTANGGKVRVWGATVASISKRCTTVPEGNVQFEYIDEESSLIRIALASSKSVLVSDPKADWIPKLSSEIDIALFQVRYPDFELYPWGGYSTSLLTD